MRKVKKELWQEVQQAAAPARQVDHVILLGDESGSMETYQEKAFESLGKQVDGIRALQNDQSRDVFFSLYGFGYQSQVRCIRHVERYSQALKDTEYQPNGQTPLYDAIGRAIQDQVTFQKDASFLVIIVTDGLENHSRKFTAESLASLINIKQALGNWTFVMLGPASARNVALGLGIPAGNFEEWDATRPEEYERATKVNLAGTQSYFVSRAAGATQTSTFYTDLSQVTKPQVLSSLDDVTSRYKALPVEKGEVEIKTFMEYKTGKPYVPGTALYQLTKTEARFQPDRNIVLRDKSTKTLYNGNPTRVREVLGLPTSGVLRLKPGNHANWDLFLESRSDNRKLVRGTEVLWLRG